MDYLTQYYKNRSEQLQEELEQLTEAVLAKGDGSYYEEEEGDTTGIEGIGPKTWGTVQRLIKRIGPGQWDDWLRSLPKEQSQLILRYLQNAIIRFEGQFYLVVTRQDGTRQMIIWNPATGVWEYLTTGTVGKYRVIDGIVTTTATASGYPREPTIAKLDPSLTLRDNGLSAVSNTA